MKTVLKCNISTLYSIVMEAKIRCLCLHSIHMPLIVINDGLSYLTIERPLKIITLDL